MKMNFELKWIKTEQETVDRFAYVAKSNEIRQDDLIELFEDIIARCNITNYFDFCSTIESEFVTYPAALCTDDFFAGTVGAYSSSLDLPGTWNRICYAQGYKNKAGRIDYFDELLKNVRMRLANLKELPQIIEV